MRKTSAIAFICFLAAACGKKNAAPEPDFTPAAVVLTTPAANSTCTTGIVVSATVSTVAFNWAAAANAESYELTAQNLLDNSKTIQTTSGTQLQVNLNRNTPYAWWIVSKSSRSSVTPKSDVYKFYNSGVAASFYAPFPADLTAPAYGQTVNTVAGKVTLAWNGADVDNDITGYDIYTGSSAATLSIVKNDLVATTFDFSVISGAVYYWKVVTKDSKGNTSTSATAQFNVN